MTTYRSKLFGFPSNVFCHSHHLVNYRVHFLEKTRKKSSKTNSNWKEIELVLSHTPILPTLKTLFLTGKSDEKNNIINQVFSQLFFLSRFWPHAKKVDHPCYVCTYVFYHMWNIWDFLFHWAWSITQIKQSQNPPAELQNIETKCSFFSRIYRIIVKNFLRSKVDDKVKTLTYVTVEKAVAICVVESEHD